MKAKNRLVIDIGTAYIKFSLFSEVEYEHYLLKFHISQSRDSGNKLFREIQRRIEDFSKYGIDQIIIMPNKKICQPMIEPMMEYYEDSKDFKKQLNTEFPDLTSNKNNVFDWVILKEKPDEDIRSIIVDGILEDDAHEFSSMAAKIEIDSFVTSPFLAYSKIFDDREPHLVVDVGEDTTRLLVVKEGAIYYTDSINMGSITITNEMEYESQYEATKMKHEQTYTELGMSVDKLTQALIEKMKETIKNYEEKYRENLKDYCIIGGAGNLEFEEEINETTINLNRTYPKLKLSNDNNIPFAVRNYLYPS